QLSRALLWLREGDASGARSLLNSGPMPSDEPLVADLERRVGVALAVQPPAQAKRREAAQKKLYLLRREMDSGVAREKKLEGVGKVLEEFPDVLSGAEQSELRRWKEELSPRPAGVDDFRKAFDLPEDQVAFPDKKRVELTFAFGGHGSPGTFQCGSWQADG